VEPDRNVIATTLPNADFGDPDCCGCLIASLHGDQADIGCNECGVIVRSVPSADLLRVLDEMERKQEIAAAICSHCGAVKLQAGFSKLLEFTCDKCGRAAILVTHDGGG